MKREWREREGKCDWLKGRKKECEMVKFENERVNESEKCEGSEKERSG